MKFEIGDIVYDTGANDRADACMIGRVDGVQEDFYAINWWREEDSTWTAHNPTWSFSWCRINLVKIDTELEKILWNLPSVKK